MPAPYPCDAPLKSNLLFVQPLRVVVKKSLDEMCRVMLYAERYRNFALRAGLFQAHFR